MRRKVLLVVMLTIIMLLQCVMPFTMVYASTSVGITLNSKLYTAVKRSLQEQKIAVSEYRDASRTIVISQDILNNVTNLNLANSEIDDLTGLDAFKNVTTLNLHANELTKDSNLGVLDSLGDLKTLDLSSNKLESIKSITSFHDLEKGDITNQVVKGQQVITVDTSSEAESRPTEVEVELPDILLEDEDGFDPDWITKTIVPANEKRGGGNPDVNFAKSLSDGTAKLVLTVASNTAKEYKALKGLIKIEINVKDTTSKLANTSIIYNFVIIDQDEVGILFKDENLYKAVKKQLTQHQEINKDLQSETTRRDLYEDCYDEALILVIKKDDVYNNIPTLILNDKMIEDLSGLEEFVGLNSYLNVSHNYIETIEKIIELEENKGTKEAEIRQKYQATLDSLKENIQAYDEQMKIVKECEEKKTEIKKQLDQMKEDNDAKATKKTELEEVANKQQEAQETADRHKALIEKLSDKLYKIYKQEYKLVSLLPIEVHDMSYKDLLESNLENIKTKATSIMDRISKLEQGDGLTLFEDWAIRTLMKKWGEKYNVTFKEQKKVFEAKKEENTLEEKMVAIENPLTEYFELVKKDTTLELRAYQDFVYIFKAIDVLSQINNYSMIARTFGNDTSKDSIDYGQEAYKEIGKVLDYEGLDKYFYNKVSEKDYCSEEGCHDDDKDIANSSKAFIFESKVNDGDLYDIKIEIGDQEYKGELDGGEDTGYKLILGHKLSILEGQELERYIYLPRIQKLNIANNEIDSLEGLETLSQLKGLNAWKNGVYDISKVDWSKFTFLEYLNLGYNQISDIEPLEVLTKIIGIDVSYNLLAGKFGFSMVNMEDLHYADFSNNQYDDIEYASTQFRLRALGKDLTVPEYLKAENIQLYFREQHIEKNATIVRTEDGFASIELPLIFRQLEKIDTENTSFGYDSKEGLVNAKGETVRLKIPEKEGEYVGYATVEGRNGTDKTASPRLGGVDWLEKLNDYLSQGSYSSAGIGLGTICKINYKVVSSSVTPDDPEDPGTDVPQDPEHPGKPAKYGYEIENEYISVYKPETSLEDFIKTIANNEYYNVTVKDNQSEDKISTGSIVTITNKAGDEVYDILEVVIKGDVNGDGIVNALDTGVVRQVINDTKALVGVYESAADVNNDGNVNSLDSLLILQYRADRIASFEK